MYKRIGKILLSTGLFFSVSSCELTDLNINQDPNNPTQASLNLLLTNVIYSASNVLADEPNKATHGFVGITSNRDRYGIDFQSFNDDWNDLYQGPFKDLDEIMKATSGDPNERTRYNPHYLGIAQVLKAYYFTLMVDLWGEVPYSEAFSGNAAQANKYPKFDEDQDIYADAFRLLNEAIVNLNKVSAIRVEGDVIYNGQPARWRRLAHSLRYKLLMQTRRVDPAAASKLAAINTTDLISSPSDDFTFQFGGTFNSDNDYRHPWFQDAYEPAENEFDYIGHQYMVEMIDNEDPRFPFYFRRQTATVLDVNNPTAKNTMPCATTPGCFYSYVVLNPRITARLLGKQIGGQTVNEAYLAGIFGRDRGDQGGIPLDGSLRTSPGAYPAGGRYDVTAPAVTGGTSRGGTGVFPMLTSWMVKMYQIEGILTLGLSGDARALFESAMRENISRVVFFGKQADATAVDPTAAAVDKYVNLFLARYDAAQSPEQKLALVLKQAWFANFGNGYELYNAFRRTGYPSDLQLPLTRVRQFPLRLPYAQTELTLNQNAPQNPVAFDAPEAAIFWDQLKFKY